jgi:hypothetical protein
MNYEAKPANNARVKIGYQDWLFICQGCTFNTLLAVGCDYLG